MSVQKEEPTEVEEISKISLKGIRKFEEQGYQTHIHKSYPLYFEDFVVFDQMFEGIMYMGRLEEYEDGSDKIVVNGIRYDGEYISQLQSEVLSVHKHANVIALDKDMDSLKFIIQYNY